MRNAEQVANRHELTITNLTISKGDFRLLDNISVRFLSGRVAVILGATGCGKSTLIRAIAGLEQANAGRIGLDQLDMTAMPAYKRAGIATVLQRPGMFPKTTPRKNLQMVMESHKSRVRNEFNKVDQILELVNLTHLADAKVDSFSGGEIARVALARAIAVDPIFLMVDEALSAIDAPLRRRILRGIADHYIAQNKGLVFVTHDQLDAFMFADHLILIDDGKIVADGSPRQIYGTPPSRSVGEFCGLATILSGFVERVDGMSGKSTAHLHDLYI